MFDTIYHIIVFMFGFIIGGIVMYVYVSITGSLPGQK